MEYLGGNRKMQTEIKIKQCTKCKRWLAATPEYFYYDRLRKDGFFPQCRDCRREYYEKYIEERRLYSKNFYQKHTEKCREASRNWKKNHPDYHKNEDEGRVNELRRINSKRRYREDKMYRLNILISRQIYDSLRENKNGRHWEILIGFTLNELRKHLEKKFSNGMIWKNYGEWEIDHIIPISSFKFNSFKDADFKKCWALKNLQPLWAEENNKKSNKLTKSN